MDIYGYFGMVRFNHRSQMQKWVDSMLIHRSGDQTVVLIKANYATSNMTKLVQICQHQHSNCDDFVNHKLEISVPFLFKYIVLFVLFQRPHPGFRPFPLTSRPSVRHRFRQESFPWSSRSFAVTRPRRPGAKSPTPRTRGTR